MALRKVRGYVISYRDNTGQVRTHGRYFRKSDAMRDLRKVLKKPQKGKTAYRDAGAWGGYGVNNPRIKQVQLLK